jgi:hypothetical protein
VENGIPISNYFYDPTDYELKHLAQYLVNQVLPSDDIRTVNRNEFKLKNIIELSLQHDDAVENPEEDICK